VDFCNKGTFEHFMLKEIHEQPMLIRALANYYLEGEGRQKLEALKSLKAKRFHIVACGTAYHAGLLIRNFIEKYNRVSVVVELASEFRYRYPLLHKDEVGLFISQSGETADTLAAQELCRAEGLKTISIVNVEGSTLYRNSDVNLLIRAGVERGVASTKAFTLQVLTGFLMAKAMNGPLDVKQIKDEMFLLADRMQLLLDDCDRVKQIAEEVHRLRGFIFTGRGPYFPVAFEGALKLKEIAYVHAEGYASGELKHGPIALIDEEMVNVAIVGPELFEKTVSNIEEVKARRAVIVSIAPQDARHVKEISNYFIPMNFDGFEDLSPLYTALVTKQFAYHMAKCKGTDIDQPRNLAKSVTVE